MLIPSRILVAIGALLLLIAGFVPVWSIYLIAPQYPEGLSMQIWLNKISGQVDIINGLNHYIGMKHIKAEMFPEFGFLIYILGAYAFLALVVAISGKRRFLTAYLVLSVIGGIAAMIDFFMWGYDYGHNLDPAAAIQVAGLSYQPPLIGHKKLLNFDAYSYPDVGAWIVIVITGLYFVIWVVEWRRKNNPTKKISSNSLVATLSVAVFLFLTSCNPEAQKIVTGTDNCVECKMTIVDPKFGAEIVTKKGKIYKFDDALCIAAFLQHRGVELSEIHQTLFVHYNEPHEFVNVSTAEFLVSSSLKSPMGGNAAAFRNINEAQKKSKELAGSRLTDWATLYNILVK